MLPLLGGVDLLIVQGDTSSALGSALAARFARVPVAHVEAGLRSHDRRRPWPEEEFRIAIDSQADLLFAPTELSAANLRRERVPGRIHVTGNTGIDAALRTLRSIPGSACNRDHPRLLVTCHRRESWGDGVASIADGLRSLARMNIASIDFILHPNPAVAAQMRLLLGTERNIQLLPPCSHQALVEAILQSDLVLSDSGGMQEEAAAFGIPLLVLREKTERPEAIAAGNLALAGLDPERIVQSISRALSQPPTRSPAIVYGDGGAADRIAAIVADWLHEKMIERRPDDHPDYASLPGTDVSRRLAT